MNLQIEITNQNEIERFICTLFLGLIEANEKELISTVELYLFVDFPDLVDNLENKGIHQEVLRFVHLMSELKTVEYLNSNKVANSRNSLKNEILTYLSSLPNNLPDSDNIYTGYIKYK